MTRMTGPDCVVMCNLINTYIHMKSMYVYMFVLFNTLVQVLLFVTCTRNIYCKRKTIDITIKGQV